MFYFSESLKIFFQHNLVLASTMFYKLRLREHPVNSWLCVRSLIPECQNAFALVVRPPTEQENLLFSFQLTAEDTLKSAWLKTLCRQVANTICRADAVRAHAHIYTGTVTSSSDHPPRVWNRTQLFILLARLSFYCGYKLEGLCGPFAVG